MKATHLLLDKMIEKNVVTNSGIIIALISKKFFMKFSTIFMSSENCFCDAVCELCLMSTKKNLENINLTQAT